MAELCEGYAAFGGAGGEERHRFSDESGAAFDDCGLGRFGFGGSGFAVGGFGLGCRLRCRGRPFEKLVAGVAQGVRGLGFADDADGGAAFAELAAQVGKIGVAGDEAELVGPVVEHGLQGVERQGDVGGVLAGNVLELEAGGEGLPDEGFLPVAGEGGVIAVAAPQHDPAKLGDDPQGVVEDLGRGVVAIDEDGDAGFDRMVRGAHGCGVRGWRR